MFFLTFGLSENNSIKGHQEGEKTTHRWEKILANHRTDNLYPESTKNFYNKTVRRQF